MAPTRLPAHVRVGPYTFTITHDGFHKEAVQLEKHGIRGICDTEHLIVYLKPEMPRQVEREVLNHELMHACFFAAGECDLDGDDPSEAFITITSPVWVSMMRDNPRLAAYLLEA